MNEIGLEEFQISGECARRWLQEATESIEKLRRMKRPDAKPFAPDSAYVLDDGRLRMSSFVAPGFTIHLHAECHDWRRVTAD